MESIRSAVKKIVETCIDKMKYHEHVDPKCLRIRIPPDRIVHCRYCNSMYSTAHVDECRECSR
jgi:hypothetical protein